MISIKPTTNKIFISRLNCDNGACNPPVCDDFYVDECGVNCGDNSSCSDCSGVPNGDAFECENSEGIVICTSDENVCEPECIIGDLNGDGGYNILDIVTLVNCVLAGDCSLIDYGCAADTNGDGGYNVLDIVALANCVLANSCAEVLNRRPELDTKEAYAPPNGISEFKHKTAIKKIIGTLQHSIATGDTSDKPLLQIIQIGIELGIEIVQPPV